MSAKFHSIFSAPTFGRTFPIRRVMAVCRKVIPVGISHSFQLTHHYREDFVSPVNSDQISTGFWWEKCGSSNKGLPFTKLSTAYSWLNRLIHEHLQRIS
jgi:hypothetical protein